MPKNPRPKFIRLVQVFIVESTGLATRMNHKLLRAINTQRGFRHKSGWMMFPVLKSLNKKNAATEKFCLK